MNKKIFVFLVFNVFLSLNVEALTGSIDLNCTSTSLKSGESTRCSINGNVDEEVSAVSIKLDVGDNLTLLDVKTDSSWQGDGEAGNIELYTDNNKRGNFPIATFTIKADSKREDITTNVVLSNVFLVDRDFNETSYTVEPLNINIQSEKNVLNYIKIDGKSVGQLSDGLFEYETIIDSTKTSINIEVEPINSSAKITGDIGTKNVDYGLNEFTITVESESGILKTYILKVIRPEVRELKSLTINNEIIELKSGVYEYKHTLKNEITSIDLIAELNNENLSSFVENYGTRKVENLELGSNQIIIKTKDGNNEELIYKIIINRLEEEIKDENPNTWNGLNYGFFALFGTLMLFVWFIKKMYIKN